MNEMQQNINWENIKKENAINFIPPIKYGKVVKVYTGDSFTILTKIPFFNETIEKSPIYKFNINLNGISSPKISSIPNVNNELGISSKNALIKWIFGKIIELSDISIDKYGKIYANVMIENININNWMLNNNFAIKSKNETKRRVSESDANSYNKSKLIFPKINASLKIDSFIESYLSSSSSISPKIFDNFILPEIKYSEKRPTSVSSSSIIQTDCFLSHNWGEKHYNHEKVKKVNDALKKRGLNTWFDESKLNGNIRFKMAEGIDNTKCVVVFITEEYRNKVNGIDMKDNCKYEFTYAMNQLGSQNMIPVIMETDMKNSSKWRGELGAALGSMLFIDLSDNTDINIEQKYDELYKKIKYIIHKESKNH